MQIPINVVINKELGKILGGCLMQLPEKYRIVFVLREIEDMNIAETVEALGISAANVKITPEPFKTNAKRTSE